MGFHRFAVSVNRRIAISAKRNYIKRSMKEFFRLNRQRIPGHYDIWVSVKRRFGPADREHIDGILLAAFNRITNNNDQTDSPVTH